MSLPAWIQHFPGAVTVCDRAGVILEMNDKSAQTFAKDGGADLVGANLFDCHNLQSQAKIRALLDSGQTNVYTVEKNGLKKLIYQSPWYDDEGRLGGLVELSLEVPGDMPHFVR